MEDVRLERAPFFPSPDPIIPLVLLLEIACWIGNYETLLPVRSAGAAYFPEWKLAFRPQFHDTGFASERHQILQSQGKFSTQNYDNITELVKNFKYEKL